MTSWEDLFTRPPSRLPVLQGGGAAASSRTGGVRCPDTIRADPWQRWWTYARVAAQAAYHDPTVAPPTLDVYGPVLDPDETALLTAQVTCSRFYGGDGTYQPSDLFVIGHPAVMIGSLALNVALNARRKAKARDAATPRWRSAQACQIIATNDRLLCHIAAQGWLSFYYEAVSEFHPDLHAWTLTLGFDDQCSPLRISGPPVPALSLWAAIGIEGHRWHNDPRLGPLLT